MNEALLVFIAVVLSLLMSKVLKLFYYRSVREAVLAGGGMPSSHCASATALVAMIFFIEGFTITFVLALAFASVVLVDAVRVRRAVGLNADMMKKMLKEKHRDEIMVEHGHTVKEAVYGCVLGLVIATVLTVLVL